MSDSTAPVRPGEELPVDPLAAYLKQHLPDLSGALNLEQFPHGHSNLTYLIRMGAKEFVLRRAPLGNQVKGAHDMGREYRVLSKLCAVYPPAPRPFLYCDDATVLDAPFYVMERRRGIVLRKSLPPGITIDPETAQRLCHCLVDNLAALHALDFKAAGLGDLGKPEGYVGRQVAGWIERFAKAQTDKLPEMGRLSKWLTDTMPKESGAALIHNDFKYDNLLVDPADLTLHHRRARLGNGHGRRSADGPRNYARLLGGSRRPSATFDDLDRPDLFAGQLDAKRTCGTLCRQDRPVGDERRVLLLFRVVQDRGDYPADLRSLCARQHSRCSFCASDELVKVLAQQADRTVNAGKL